MTRVRFAPSPTGFLHMGSARTALFNYVYARACGGTFILRVEDTDLARSKQEFLREILDDLTWLGLSWDEGPFYQTKRFERYREQAEALIAQDRAYREGSAVLFSVEKGRTVHFDDLIHGPISVSTDEIKDQVCIKSDGSPAYNFACVVDDIDMGITHILRGDDHISNTPKQVLFYEAFQRPVPHFAHVPLIMGQDGAKLSKRHGAVSVEAYRREGFLPEALANYLLLLGWSPGKDREIFTVEEAIGLFQTQDMTGVQARFDLDKLRWMNGEYIMRSPVERLRPLIIERLIGAGVDPLPDEAYLDRVIGLYKMRMKTLNEFFPAADYFFSDVYTVDEKGAAQHLADPLKKEHLHAFAARLEQTDDFSCARLESVCRELASERALKAGQIIHPTRMAVSGKTTGAGLFEIMETLGKERVLRRMSAAAR